MSGGKCPGGTCPGFFCPVTYKLHITNSLYLRTQLTNYYVMPMRLSHNWIGTLATCSQSVLFSSCTAT